MVTKYTVEIAYGISVFILYTVKESQLQESDIKLFFPEWMKKNVFLMNESVNSVKLHCYCCQVKYIQT